MCIACLLSNPRDLLAGYDQHTGSTYSAINAANPGDAFWSGFGVVTEVADAPESTSTPYSLRIGQSAEGAISSSVDEDWYAVQLVAGVTYDFRLLGLGQTFLGDPLLRLMDSTGNQIASDDDGFSTGSPNDPGADEHATDSRLIFTATTTGTFYLQADAFSTGTGDYLLTATQRDVNGMVFTVDEIAWQLINPGNQFFSSPQAAAFVVGGDNTLTVNLAGLTTEGQFLANNALQVWSAFTGITFLTTNGVAEITFDDALSGAFAQPLYSGSTIASATVNIGLDWLTQFGTTLDSYSFETYIHEIGHALGLAHGGNYNGSATYGSDNYYLNDSVAWSIMSYMNAFNDEFDFGNPSDVNTYVGASFRYMYTPMIADMIAIQHLYGVNTGAFTGDTTWGFGSNTGVAALDEAVDSGALMAMMVYDMGGTDTLNFSNASVFQLITLNAESLSSVLGGTHNLGIARGVTIENAIGGSGVDQIYGNAAANTLNGGAGIDITTGGLGDDTHIVDNAADVVVEGAGEGTNDRVAASVSYVLAAGVQVERLTTNSSTGSAAINLTGNSLTQSITGNAGANVLSDGGGAADVMTGLGGNDNYIVRNAGTTIVESGGGGTADRVSAGVSFTLAADDDIEIMTTTSSAGTSTISLTGNALAQTMTGNAGINTFRSIAGVADTMSGLGGDDIYRVFNAGDQIIETAGNGTNDRVITVINFTLGAGDSIELFTTDSTAGVANLRMFGNELGQTIQGNAGNNRIDGKEGTDSLRGNLGSDTFIFSTTLGATNIDTIVDFTAANDQIELDQTIFATIVQAAGVMLSGYFKANTTGTATDANDHIIYDTDGGQLYYDTNGNVAGGVTQFAQLVAGTSLAFSDFNIVA